MLYLITLQRSQRTTQLVMRMYKFSLSLQSKDLKQYTTFNIYSRDGLHITLPSRYYSKFPNPSIVSPIILSHAIAHIMGNVVKHGTSFCASHTF